MENCTRLDGVCTVTHWRLPYRLVILSLVDNTLLHYLVVPTADTIKLHPAEFDGVIATLAVRLLLEQLALHHT